MPKSATSTKTPEKFTLAKRAPLARQLFSTFQNELKKRRDGTIKPVPVPWPALASSLNGGLWPKTSTILAGATGTGKTSMAVAIAAHAAYHGVPTLFLSLELDAEEMAARIFAIDAGVAWSDLLLGRGSGALDAATEQAMKAVMGSWPLHVASPSGRMRYEDIGRYIAALRDEYASELTDEDGGQTKPCLVVVDYVQLLDDPDNSDTRTRVGDAAIHLRALAKEHHAAMLVISSVARGNYDALSGWLGQGPGARQG